MLPELQAEQQLAAIEATALPDMKPDARASVLRRLRQYLRGPSVNAVSGSSAVDALTRAGIPIERVPRKRR